LFVTPHDYLERVSISGISRRRLTKPTPFLTITEKTYNGRDDIINFELARPDPDDSFRSNVVCRATGGNETWGAGRKCLQKRGRGFSSRRVAELNTNIGRASIAVESFGRYTACESYPVRQTESSRQLHKFAA
jgi:hypothetical protein